MRIAEARTLHARLINRSHSDPTRSAATLQDVITEHGPQEMPDGRVVCSESDCNGHPYPCATTRTIALGLRIPLPEAVHLAAWEKTQ